MKNKSHTKTIERIRKLLAMSRDIDSPQEAAIAASRVAKLMAEYNIEMDEVIRHELNNNDSLIEVSFEKKQGARYDLWLQGLSVTIATALDCKVKFESIDQSNQKKLVFQGFEPDVIVANWLLGYCFEQIERLGKQSGGKGRSFLHSFKRGAANTVTKQIEHVYRKSDAEGTAVATNGPGNSLMVIKQDLIEKKYGKAEYSTQKSSHSDASAFHQGRKAGESVNVQHVMGSDIVEPAVLEDKQG